MYHDCHQDSQDDQEDQEWHLNARMFLMPFFVTNIHVSYIFEKLRQNPVADYLGMLLTIWQCCYI